MKRFILTLALLAVVATGWGQTLSVGEVAQSSPVKVFASRTSTAQTIGNATETVVVFNSESVDTKGAYNPSTGVFTAPTSGVYCISPYITWDGANAGYRQLELSVNGTRYLLATQPGTGTVSIIQNYCTYSNLSAGDNVCITVYQTSGANLDILADTTIGLTGLVIFRLF